MFMDQVFLSFRGLDTRLGFTDCLYHFLVDAGIRVFRDNEELRPGERIQEILGAIDNSLVCIPIFSKDYASSKWCLRELAEMVERKKKIMPIFYDVTPDDVKLKTCLYRDALTRHEKEKEKEQWAKALMEVAELTDLEPTENKGEKALTEVVKIKGWELKSVGHMLREVDRSIGKLKKLKHLNLNRCRSLQGLPGEIGSLEALEEIYMEGSHRSFTLLPECIGNLKSLLILEIADAHICQLPNSIGRLRKVKCLSLKGCHRIRQLPDSIGEMASLVELDLSYTGITELPDSLGDLDKLERLSLMACRGIKGLPDSLNNLISLIELDISLAQLIELPYSIGDLKNLKVIKMDGCSVRKLPTSIGKMKKLEELYADGSSLEGEIPTEIGMLSCLRTLDLSDTKICSLPSTISQLSSLQAVKLHNVLLEELPRFPTSLVHLEFISLKPLDMAPDFSELNNLTCLILQVPIKENAWGQNAAILIRKKSGQSVFLRPMQEWAMSRRLSWIGYLDKLEDLYLCLPNVPSLPTELGDLSRLRRLSVGWPKLRRIPQLPCNLVILHLTFLPVNVKLPCIAGLKELMFLAFEACQLGEDGYASLRVEEINKLEFLVIHDDLAELNGLRLPVSLKRLDVIGCARVTRLPDVSHLKNLEMVCLKDCPELVEVPGLAELEPLPEIFVESCASLTGGKEKPEHTTNPNQWW